jgi:phage recombination protein Bet
MAVKNSLTEKKGMKNEMSVEYEAAGIKIALTPTIVRDYLVSGDKDRASTQEIVMFMNLCKSSGLNPWAKEAYCIKYGNEPATMVVGKEAFMKRAELHPSYDGYEAGIIVINEDGEIIRRAGSFKLQDEEIIGGYAEVWRKDRTHSYVIEVSFEEYAGRKKDGTLNAQWKKKPATMIRKVALVQALREAFPSAFGGMYSAEESGFVESETGDVFAVTQTEPLIEAARPEAAEAEILENAEAKTQAVPAVETVEAGQQVFFQ